jgi:hypothetical protein
VTHSEITVTRRSEDLAEVVTVAGEIDIATYGQLRTMQPPVNWQVRAVVAVLVMVRVIVTGVVWLYARGRDAWHRSRCGECRHAQ